LTIEFHHGVSGLELIKARVRIFFVYKKYLGSFNAWRWVVFISLIVG
jgi:hypothetical protein